MSAIPRLSGIVCAVFVSALAIQTICLSPATAWAQQGQNPYQVEEGVADSTTCAPQCILHFPQVPNGKRLVITNVSGQLGPSADSFVIEGNGVAFFVPKGYPTAGVLAAPVTVYFEQGSTPTARFFVPDTTQHTSLIVIFVGYLVPAQ
jgi:hypothetical protein